MRLFYFSMLVSLMVLCSTGVTARDLTLDQHGRVYQLTHQDDQLVLIIAIDNQQEQVVKPVPGTTGDWIEKPIVMFDDTSNTAVLIWQHNMDINWSMLMLATYRDGNWVGPVPVAGMDGTRASNPDALLHVISFEGKDSLSFNTTYLYLAWWSDEYSESGGYAVSATIPMVDGMPLLGQMEREEHNEINPFHIACTLSGTESNLKQPKMFFNPANGYPHIALVSIRDCMFSILEIKVEIDENAIAKYLDNGSSFKPLDAGATAKRRRRITVWNKRRSYTVHPTMRLGNAKFDVGYELSIVMYWDKDNMIDYAVLNDQPHVEDSIKTLQLTDVIDHERAVELIRERVHK